MSDINSNIEHSVAFLIINFGTASEVLLSTPLIRCIKNQIEGAEIDFLTTATNAPFVQRNPNIDNVLIFSNKIKETAKEINYNFYDYLIDLHSGFRSKQLTRRVHAASFSIKNYSFDIWKHINFGIVPKHIPHFIERSFATVSVFDVENDQKGVDFFLNTEIDKPSIPDSYILLAIQAKNATRKLPAEKVLELCRKLNHKIVITHNAEDIQTTEYLKNKLGEKIINWSENTDIQQIAYLISQSKLVISYDSEIMHLATAFEKITISIWGNTVSIWGNAAFNAAKHTKQFEVEQLKCRPCTKNAFLYCPKKHFKCMNEMNIDAIANYINELNV